MCMRLARARSHRRPPRADDGSRADGTGDAPPIGRCAVGPTAAASAVVEPSVIVRLRVVESPAISEPTPSAIVRPSVMSVSPSIKLGSALRTRLLAPSPPPAGSIRAALVVRPAAPSASAATAALARPCVLGIG